MRLLFSAVLALSLAGALAGCGHMAGVCDSDYGCDCGCEGGSCGMPIDDSTPSVPTPALKPNSMQKMPRGDSKPLPAPADVIPGL